MYLKSNLNGINALSKTSCLTYLSLFQQNDELLSDNSDYLFQTPSILREPSSIRKRKKTGIEKTKESGKLTDSPVTPSPKRSQRLMQRRQIQKALVLQHSKISPGNTPGRHLTGLQGS